MSRPHNAAPRARLTQVEFDEKTPQDLLQILNDVFAELDSRHQMNLRDEPPEQTGARMIELLALLKYQLPTTDMCVFWMHARSATFASFSPVQANDTPAAN